MQALGDDGNSTEVPLGSRPATPGNRVDRFISAGTRPGSSKLAFHASRIIIDTGVLIAMAAMSMPFVTTDGADRSSVATDALPVIILLAPVFLITMIPDHSRPMPTSLGWLSMILGIAAFPYAVVKYLDAGALAETLGGRIGFGARLLIFGTFVTIVGIGVGLARNLLRLPSGGTYPGRRAAPARKAPPQQTPHRQATQEQTTRSQENLRRKASPEQTPRPRPRQTGDTTSGSFTSGTDPATPPPQPETTPPRRAAQSIRPSRPDDPGER